jgi:hypothetical protein
MFQPHPSARADDITHTHLEAAILDQVVAGAFAGQAYAFVSVYHEGAWRLGVAVANEPGYCPITGKIFSGSAESERWANGLNVHIGLSEKQAFAIVSSTMREGQPVVEASR